MGEVVEEDEEYEADEEGGDDDEEGCSSADLLRDFMLVLEAYVLMFGAVHAKLARRHALLSIGGFATEEEAKAEAVALFPALQSSARCQEKVRHLLVAVYSALLGRVEARSVGFLLRPLEALLLVSGAGADTAPNTASSPEAVYGSGDGRIAESTAAVCAFLVEAGTLPQLLLLSLTATTCPVLRELLKGQREQSSAVVHYITVLARVAVDSPAAFTDTFRRVRAELQVGGGVVLVEFCLLPYLRGVVWCVCGQSCWWVV